MKTVPKQWDTQFEGKVIEKQEPFPITLSCTCTCVVNIMYCMFIRTFLYFVSIEFCFSFKNIIFSLFLYQKMEKLRSLVIHYCATLYFSLHFLISLLDSDVLWDGEDCDGVEGPCCTNPNLPWFYRKLDEQTTDDLELRLCNTKRGFSSISGNTPIDIVELFIH